MIRMFKLDGNDTSTVLLETGRGWFILSATDDATCPGFVVDYKEVGKPICSLALIQHDLQDDELRTHVWEDSDSSTYNTACTFVHERPQCEELNTLVATMKKINTTHEGLDLEIQYWSDQNPRCYHLGYANPKTSDFVTLQTFKFIEATSADVKECAHFYGWSYTEL